MSATVLDLRPRLQAERVPGETIEQAINRRVLALLRGKSRGETIAMAQRKALRIMREEPNTSIGKAIQRAIVWAVCEDEPNPNPPRPAA